MLGGNNLWANIRQFNDLGGFDFGFPFGLGKIIWLDPANGSDNFDGSRPDYAWKTLPAAFDVVRANKNDAIVLIADGTTASSARLSAAFDWNKAESHMFGICAPGLFSNRARIAPTAAITAFANFFTVSAEGCFFKNLQWYQDFDTDTDNQIALTLSSARTVIKGCHIGGIAKGADAGGRSLLITSSSGNKGEHLLDDCTIGLDTISRGAASAQIGFAGTQVPRVVIRNSRVVSWATAAAALMVTAGANAIDRFALFDNVDFLNFGTALTKLSSINASQNGKFIYKNCNMYGIPIIGDTANSLIMGYAPSNVAAISVAPNA